jgi:hypothetical protein
MDSDGIMMCFSCIHARPWGCEAGKHGWPEIGALCSGFSYEPGTSPSEFDSAEEYERAAQQMGKRHGR